MRRGRIAVPAKLAACRLPRSFRILRRCDYLAIQKRGERVRSDSVVFRFLLRNGPALNAEEDLPALFKNDHCLPLYPRLGITMSRKVGNAVHRNRMKRLVRESFRQCAHKCKLPIDIVVVGKPQLNIASVSVDHLISEFERVFHLASK